VTADRLLRPTLSGLWTFLAIALPALGALVAPMPTVDLAYHLRAGADILDGHGIPSADSWTFTIPGVAWPDQQWGAQATLAAAYRLAGWDGLAILRAGLVAATFGLLFLVVRYRAPQLSRRATALIVLAAFVVTSPTLALRPQLFAVVLFAASLLVLAARGRHPRLVWFLPVLALLWANLHGSFPLVIVLAGLAWLADFSATSPRARRDRHVMLAVAGFCALATVVNPLGPGVWSYVVSLASNQTIGTRVSEWRPPGLTDAPGILFWVSVLVVAAFLGWCASRGRAATRHNGTHLRLLPRWPALLTLATFAALGAVTGRGLAWWPLVAVFVCSGFITEGVDGRGASGAALPARDRRSPLNSAFAGLLIVAAFAALPFWRPIGPAGVPNGTLSYAPQALTAALSTSAAWQERVWNPQRWGSWLELAVPKLFYATDSRIELYPQSVWRDADLIAAGSDAGVDVLARDEVLWVVTDPATDAATDATLGRSLGWLRSYWGCDGSIWQRSTEIGSATLHPAPPLPAPRCP
jgi:hypothetical protein